MTNDRKKGGVRLMWEVDREWYQAARTLHFGLKLLVGLLIILFCTALFVDSAHAAVVQSTYDGVVWGIGVVEKPNGSSMESYNPVEGCIVNAPNAFSAACFAVGGNPATLTSDQKALLSNASTGGDFYTFTQNFANYGGSFDSPDDWYVPKFYDVWNMFENLYGDDLYAATFTSAQLRGAKADYQLILDGGSIGGGGSSGGTIGDTLTYTAYRWNSSKDGITLGGTRYYIDKTPFTPDSYTVTLNQTILDFISQHPDCDVFSQINGSTNQILIWVVPAGKYTINKRSIIWSGGTNDVPVSVTFNDVTYYNASVGFDTSTSTSTHFDIPDGNVSFFANRVNGTATGNLTNITYFSEPVGGGGEPVVPPTNWPDNPTVTAPEPPEIPEPYNPIIDEQPIDPTPPQNPIFPPILSITEETYTADLQGILDAMDAHCQHLRSSLHTEVSNLWTALSTKMTNDFTTFRTYMTGQIGWLGDLISDELEATRDYMQQLAEWLAEQIEYSFTGTAYDDNTLISWLRKIYYRLGNGGVNTRPVDPVANPDDEGDWLSQLIANFFSALDSLAGGLLTTVGSALELMQAKFPFSLPWDLLAILGLLEASPIAPDFDVPIYTLSSAGQLLQVGAWEIDLSDLSPYLEGIRWMQKICFIYFLAVNTKSWMETIEKVVA